MRIELLDFRDLDETFPFLPGPNNQIAFCDEPRDPAVTEGSQGSPRSHAAPWNHLRSHPIGIKANPNLRIPSGSIDFYTGGFLSNLHLSQNHSRLVNG
jgi:hypothetical protein